MVTHFQERKLASKEGSYLSLKWERLLKAAHAAKGVVVSKSKYWMEVSQ